MTVFNRANVRRHRDRAAADLAGHDFLFLESADRLLDRLGDIKRTFPLALDLGCHSGQIGRALKGQGGIEKLVQCDLSPRMAVEADLSRGLGITADEEALPFGPGVFDLILSNLSLHWVNDLPGALLQARLALKPDGLFLAAMLGGDTLQELRQALAAAEIAVEGGLSPRVSPMADVRDLGSLLQRAGFALPVVDTDTVTVIYDNPLKLMADMRAMGESNATIEARKGMTRKATMMAAVEKYQEMFQDPDGKIPATFQIITMTGWAPDASQQQPLKPGAAEARLADALGSEEIPLEEKAKP